MSQHSRNAALLLVLLSLAPFAAQAKVFRCEAANGELTFSQTPCPDEKSKVTEQRTVGRSDGDPVACEHAHRFALATAQEMKSGTDSSALFDRYGGLGALSKGSVSLISYVYQFRTNNDVPAERVAALSTAKCQAQSFGDVSCEQLPVSFTDRLGGCDKDAEDGEDIDNMYASTTPMPLQGNRQESESDAVQRAQKRDADARDEQQRMQCKQNFKAQIASINSQMRSGYTSAQGESLKKKRRDFENRLRDC
ncbi:MAG: DUF4124 domain-containing protein [Woeseiaceae bacterium]